MKLQRRLTEGNQRLMKLQRRLTEGNQRLMKLQQRLTESNQRFIKTSFEPGFSLKTRARSLLSVCLTKSAR